ncbi:chitin synthesis regulation, resistance to congo red-domain-containing protein [Xylariaceae sp. FL0804]|nr:chitin synthesis regulation, resistance to congo red-domain-containing protein [Xylariaceae sp. FL0804]
MAPFLGHATAQLSARWSRRYQCDNGYDRYGRCYNGWSYYGRWVFAGVVIVVVLLIFFLLACVNSRRRRRRGASPMYGTGWMAGHPNNGQYYNNQQGYNQPAPPAYGAPQSEMYPMNNHHHQQQHPAQGVYGQQSGVEAPKNTYAGSSPNPNYDYAPPSGPPPK